MSFLKCSITVLLTLHISLFKRWPKFRCALLRVTECNCPFLLCKLLNCFRTSHRAGKRLLSEMVHENSIQTQYLAPVLSLLSQRTVSLLYLPTFLSFSRHAIEAWLSRAPARRLSPFPVPVGSWSFNQQSSGTTAEVAETTTWHLLARLGPSLGPAGKSKQSL